MNQRRHRRDEDGLWSDQGPSVEPIGDLPGRTMNDFSLEPPIRTLLDQPSTVLLRDAVFVREEIEPIPWTHIALAVSIGANLGLVVLLAALFGVVVSL